MRTILLAAALAALSIVNAPARADVPELKYFVEVAVPDLDDARVLAAAGFDIAGVDRKASLVGIVVTPDELPYLQSFGWPVTIRRSNAETHAVDALSDYTDPQEMSAFMDAVAAAYPTLVRKITLGGPFFEGQTQYALQITKDVTQPNERPSFILDRPHMLRPASCGRTRDLYSHHRFSPT